MVGGGLWGCIVTDKAKRDAAVDAFAMAIKVRMDEQAALEYFRWDGKYSNYELCDAIAGAAVMASQGRTDQVGRYAIDIGERAMMLHFRATKHATTSEVLHG
jgi:hypothetical protein